MKCSCKSLFSTFHCWLCYGIGLLVIELQKPFLLSIKSSTSQRQIEPDCMTKVCTGYTLLLKQLAPDISLDVAFVVISINIIRVNLHVCLLSVMVSVCIPSEKYCMVGDACMISVLRRVVRDMQRADDASRKQVRFQDVRRLRGIGTSINSSHHVSFVSTPCCVSDTDEAK